MEDLLYRFLGLYKKSPLWVKKTVGTVYGMLPYSVRYGKRYEDYKKLARSARSWSVEQRDTFLYEKLKQLITHAQKHYGT